MAKIIYLEDRINGLHCYTPEMGQRKPDVKLEARLSHYGNKAVENGIDYTYKPI